MKLFKKMLIVTAVASAMAAPAQAGVMGVSDLIVLGLGFINPAGIASIVITDESRTGNASATYNGVTQADATLGGNGTINVVPQCVGDCVNATTLYLPPDNALNHIGLAPLYNYAIGDIGIKGAAFGGPIEGLTRANAVANNPTNSGSANATIFNGGSISGNFTPTSTFTSAVFVDVDAFLRTWISALNPGEAATAGAGFGWNLQVLDGATSVLNFTPTELNQSFYRVTTGDTLFTTGGTKQYTSNVVTYTQDTVYTFAINQSSNAAITNRIPEPSSLALLGLGLLGVSAIRRRQSTL